MPIASNLRLEVLDIANTSGDPVLVWAFSEGNLDGTLDTRFNMKFQKGTNKAVVPTIVRGIGQGLDHPSQVSNAALSLQGHGASGQAIYVTNDSWTSAPNTADIAAQGWDPPNIDDAAYQTNLMDGSQVLSVYEEGGGEIFGTSRARADVIRVFESPFLLPQDIQSGTSRAWISYDVSSGVNNKTVFAYSMEFLHSISGNTGVSGVNIQSGVDYSPSQLLFYSGYAYSGNCSNIGLLLDQTGLSCELPAPFNDEEPYEVCLQSGLSSGALTTEINRILGSIRDQEASKGSVLGDAVDDSEITSDNVSLRYTVYKGVIEYNQPYAGDQFCLYPYSYDFTGEYQDAYGVLPPYPAQHVCFSYPADYSSISGLASKINTVLSGTSYKIWNRQVCVEQNLSGYFETGGLLKATVSGNNHILIEALREGAVGRYQFSFYAADRPFTGIEPENLVKYLLPRKVSLQAADVYGSWTTLDSHSSIPWSTVRPHLEHNTLYEFYTGFNTGSNGEQNPQRPETTASGSVVKRKVYEATVSGQNVCSIGFTKVVEFYEVPQGFSCQPSGDSDSINLEDGDGDGGAFTGVRERVVDYSFLKTGWKFNATTGYNYYRLYLEDFIAEGNGRNIQISDSFHVNSITLFGVDSGTRTLSGSMCIVGSSYTGQIMGYTSGVITGVLSGQANASGLLCFNRYVVTGAPASPVWFQHKAGVPTEPFTGLVNACATGTGYYAEDVYGYYYNATQGCVEFVKQVSGTVTGSGNLLGGPYAIITDSWAATGASGSQIVAGSGEGMLTGVIPNFVHNFENVPAFGQVTGNYVVVIDSNDGGVANVSEIIYGFPTQVYSIALSGTRQATAVMALNSPASGDFILINGVPVYYSPYTGDSSPIYYSGLSSLASIINTNSTVFGATGSVVGTSLRLTSILGGKSGNFVGTSSSGSAGRSTFGATTFTGGANYYYPLSSAEPFSGLLSLSISGTGFYTQSGAGYLTGSLKMLDFIRRFTGIWGLSTGDFDFRSLGWITGSQSKYQNSGFQNLPFYTGQPNIIPMLVTYNNEPLVLSNDIARLTVTGYGTNTGLSMLLSGQF